ncbi:zinc finger MYM-type protein 1-like [Aphis craccivora]|uniref:Zinc finger MYM-type protein 1-like n=1 Tax=Aphis craccivora TaxID=307492 RepID=A0A6G0YHS8_APHCR|nr:zinc finger MYM-type protein 1-like [Aphis craccivora]
MSGTMSGVQTRIKDKYPAAVYIHCLPYKLNLILCSTCNHIKEARNFFNILEAVHVHFAQSN